MIWKKEFILPLSCVGLAFLFLAFDQQAFGGHMMGGGMMGGGMMGQAPNGDSTQNLSESQSEEARIFRKYCGQCHVPPPPSAHTSREWSTVVARMRQHMVTQGKAVPESDEMGEILDYLQRNAS